MWQNRPLLISDSLLQKAEPIIAVLLALVIVSLHYAFMLHGGALWRDEVNTINLAAVTPLSELWHHLRLDSFPVLAYLLLRLYSNIVPATDSALRFFGFLIGISILAALWFTARSLGLRTPLLSVLLFAFNPFSIIYPDSIRPYGVGILFALLSFAMIARVMKQPGAPNVALALIASVLCVHSLYQNAFFLMSFVFAAMIITALRRNWKKLSSLALVFFVPALSLLPYWPIVKKAQSWLIIMKASVDLSWLLGRLSLALAAVAQPLLFVWPALFLLAIGFTAYLCFSKAAQNTPQEKKDMCCFCAIVMTVSTVLFFCFLRLVRVITQPWYYLPLIAVVAVCLDVIIAAKKTGAILRIVLVLIVVPPAFTSVLNKCRVKQTNIDVTASVLKKLALSDDLIVLHPWYIAIGFQRYYDGSAPIDTIPPMEDHKFHRYDLFKECMISSQPLQPLLAKISNVLKAGHNVWIVKEEPCTVQKIFPFPLPPAPNSPFKWVEMFYRESWYLQTFDFIHTLPVRISYVPSLTDKPVSQYENCCILQVSPLQ